MRIDAATKALRYAAIELIDRKLTGDRRRQAVAFVRRTGVGSKIEALMQRLEHLPDIEREAHPNAVLTDAAVVEMRAAHAAGVSSSELARRYGISTAQSSRILRGISRRQTLPQDEPEAA